MSKITCEQLFNLFENYCDKASDLEYIFHVYKDMRDYKKDLEKYKETRNNYDDTFSHADNYSTTFDDFDKKILNDDTINIEYVNIACLDEDTFETVLCVDVVASYKHS